MSSEPTVPQGGEDHLRSQQLSLKRPCPPAQVSGYELERPLGAGAYGEVWVAIERNTGRRVAIKFYAHRGGLDWSLLSREVEKLAFLFADRYVVQLIGVGWDADPPYYIMEYLERGSLAERLHQGPLTVHEAVEIFHDVAIGLAHAHNRGVLHCDLKPANILLDQDSKPRLADFGQSRLSHEQAPALGTLFYMAPEQADLNAMPDARWDVYALGALLYAMLTGEPPYRALDTAEPSDQTTDLNRRLSQYRHLLRHSPAPAGHRRIPGVDRYLAEIVEGCLATNPLKRFPNIQSVLDALALRATRRARRPMMILGAVGPVLLLAVVSLFAWWGFHHVLRESDEGLMRRALESNRFAAEYVARAAASELESRWRSIERVAYSDGMLKTLKTALADREFANLLAQLSDPHQSEAELGPLREKFGRDPLRKGIQAHFAGLIAERPNWRTATWFLCDFRGVQLARIPEFGGAPTIGRCFAFRAYFTGLGEDRPVDWRPKSAEHVSDTTLCRVYRGQGSGTWMVPSSTPIVDEGAGQPFVGVVGVSLEVGRLVDFAGVGQQLAVLVDMTPGPSQGIILQHPLLKRLADQKQKMPERLAEPPRRVVRPPSSADEHFYRDPMANDALGAEFDRRWLAHSMPVIAREQKTGWMVIIQEDYDASTGQALDRLRRGLVRYGLLALAMVAVLMLGLWVLAIRVLAEAAPRRRALAAQGIDTASSASSVSGSAASAGETRTETLPP